MHQQIKQVPVWAGAVIGAMLTPAFIAVLFLGERFAGLPFVPFDFFNWIARILPGPLITFGIDRMVDLLILFGQGADLDVAAKTSEQTLALLIFWGLGITAGAVFFAVLNRIRFPNEYIPGWLLAGVLGIPLIAIVMQVNVAATAPQQVQIVWLLLLFAGYGLMFSWAYYRLGAAGVAGGELSAGVVGRREFMIQLGGATAILTVLGAGLGALLRTSEEVPRSTTGAVALTDGSGQPLPNANAALQPAPGTRLEYTPVNEHYRIDILSGGLPSIPEDYTLPITGLVANPAVWSLEDIRAMPSMDAFITMSCISNRIGGSLISTTKWTGVSFQHILEQLEPDENAVALKITGADGFDEYLGLDLIRADERIMLAYAFDDAPLPLRNGYPLRVHIPNHYGMKQPKWITSIEVVESHEAGYWVRRGWSPTAIVNATSVIDTVALDAIYTDSRGEMRVPIGGMAWAGDRRIIRVEVQVDDGEWAEAELRDPLSERSWVIWRYDWAFVEGAHTFAVRCYEAAASGQGDAILQPTASRGTRPDGATGIHSVQEFVRLPQPETESSGT